MNITILNGNPYSHNQEFDRYLDLYKVKMHNTEHYVRSFMLRDMKIQDLRSMDSINTMDVQEFTDDFRYILNSLEETDLLIIASPLEQGFLAGLTKMILDRLSANQMHSTIIVKGIDLFQPFLRRIGGDDGVAAKYIAQTS